jgi:1-deoxy-D-xylulose-5-phosphate synthase
MRPDESEYDPFVTGHASNSLAAAYGIYKANHLKGKNATTIAVIGDGSMTGGLALEALNNIGGNKGNFIIVLNDNKMSISKNVGSMSAHLKKIRLNPSYYRFKSGTENILFKIPIIGKPLHSLLAEVKNKIARLLFRNNMFECLGFKYIGPVDGHNIEQLKNVLEIAREQKKPCVVHAITVKGKGYPFAEQQPGEYHGVSAFDSHDGLSSNCEECFSSVAGKTLCRLAEDNLKICAITAAMTTGTGLIDEIGSDLKDGITETTSGNDAGRNGMR